MAFAALEGFPNRKGSGVRIRHTVQALAAEGAEVTLLTLRGDETGAPLPPGVHHHPLKVLDDNYLSRALTFGHMVGRALYTLRPDVVHVRGPFEGAAALEYARTRQAAFIFEVNGLPSVELRYHHPRAGQAHDFLCKLRAQEQHLLQRADLVLTQSQATARFVRLRAQGPLRPVVVPNGADPERFCPGPGPAHAQDEVRLLYSGSLAPWQGLMDLLPALRQARREAELRLTILGPARRAWTRAILTAARRFKVQDLLQLEAAGDTQAVAEHIQAADICLAPLARDSRNRVQGCSPIKLFEYMAAGRAVLASDLPCVREIVQPEVTGLLHKPSNPHRLREALLTLASQPRLRHELGLRARRWVLQEATWAHRHHQLVTAYASMLAEKTSRASA